MGNRSCDSIEQNGKWCKTSYYLTIIFPSNSRKLDQTCWPVGKSYWQFQQLILNQYHQELNNGQYFLCMVQLLSLLILPEMLNTFRLLKRWLVSICLSDCPCLVKVVLYLKDTNSRASKCHGRAVVQPHKVLQSLRKIFYVYTKTKSCILNSFRVFLRNIFKIKF